VTIIIPANSAADTAYEVANSCRFNDGDSPYMHKTPGSNGNRQTWTFSAWIKRGVNSGTNMNIFSQGNQSGDDFVCYIDGSTSSLNMWDDGTLEGESAGVHLRRYTSRLLRDPSAWYHICIAVDTTDGTAGDRVKVYINGVQETSFSSSADPDQNLNTHICADSEFRIGRQYNDKYFDGYIAEVCLIDGSALAPTSFGEFDSDSPTIWKPKDVSELTFGTNGFYLDFEDSANLGNDANGGTDLTEVNFAATDQAVDTPTNSFCTMNPLNEQAWTYSEGNCQLTNTSSSWRFAHGTMGASTGKWYFEAENDAYGAGAYIGVVGTQDISHGVDENFKTYATGYGYKGGDGTKANNASGASYGDTWTSGDIIGCALDLTNGAIYWSKNGTWQNSATTAEIAAGTTTNAAYTSIPSGEGYIYLPAVSGKTNVIWKMNIGGCPTYTISSGNQDANGYGNFEYPPPSGFLAYSSKNIGGS
jgi:hypothetical protein